MATSTLISADQFDTMSFDRPVELIRGEIVEMTGGGTDHATVCANLTAILWNWSKTIKNFQVLSNDPGIQTQTNPDSIRCPDIAVASQSKLAGEKSKIGRLVVPPEVVIEVKSPSNTWKELIAKSLEFMAAGVNEVWIVDPASRHVHVFQEDTEPTILEEQDTITSQFLPEFRCQVSEFFLNVAREHNP